MLAKRTHATRTKSLTPNRNPARGRRARADAGLHFHDNRPDGLRIGLGDLRPRHFHLDHESRPCRAGGALLLSAALAIIAPRNWRRRTPWNAAARIAL